MRRRLFARYAPALVALFLACCTATPEPDGAQPTPPGARTVPRPPEEAPTAPAPTGEDQTRALQAFLDSIPDGGTGELRPGAEYVVNGTLRIEERSGITLIGRGATFRATRLVGFRPGSGWRYHLVIEDSEGITVRDLRIRSVDGGELSPEYYGEHAVAILGSRDVRLRGMEISGVAGDGVYVSESLDTGARTRGVRMSGLHVRNVGRHALAVVDGKEILLRSSSASGCYTFVDLEPHRRQDSVVDVRIVGNSVGAVRTVFLGAYGFGLVGDVAVMRNRATGTPLRADIGLPSLPPRRRFSFVGNVSRKPVPPDQPALVRLWGVRGFRFTDNRQRFAGGQVAIQARRSCGLVSARNTLLGAGGLLASGRPCR